MKIMNNLRIRTRLMISLIIPVVLTASAVAIVTTQQMKAAGEHQIELLEADLMESKKESLQDLVGAVEAIFTESFLTESNLSADEMKKKILSRVRSIEFGDNNYIFVYERAPSPHKFNNLAYRPDPTKEGLVDPHNKTLKDLLGNLFDAAERSDYYAYQWGNPATGKEEPKISYATVIDRFNWMVGAGVYVNDITAKVDESRAQLEDQIESAIILIAIVSLFAIIISLLIGGFVGRTVTGPIQRATGLMSEIARGEGDLTRRLPEEGRDELSQLGAEFNAFVSKIQDTIREVGKTTYQVASAAEELSRVASETRESVQSQGSETDLIASAINEMASTIHQVSQNANEVQSHSTDADRMSKEGGKTMATSQDVVNRLSENILSSAEVIEALASRSNEIQSVLDVIHEVTDQTNLLALNAAIEAARAGEHGRGFAVVADEVRQLARRSDESASQIREMIDGFITESGKAVEKMRSSKELSDETVERINHATTTLNTIEKSIGGIADQITQIATGSEQQSQVAEEINKNITRIVEAAQSSSNGVEQTNESSQELATLAEGLRSLVGQFKV